MRASTSKGNVAAKRTTTTTTPARKPSSNSRRLLADEIVFPPATQAEISQELLWDSMARLETQAESLQREITTLRRLVFLLAKGGKKSPPA